MRNKYQAGAAERNPAVRRRRWFALFAVLMSVTGTGLAIELGIRALAGAPVPERLPLLMIQANRFRGWEMIPNLDHYTYQHLVSVNELGLRSGPIPEKTPGEYRILAVGDSLIYGQGVADDQTIPAYMERLLRERDSRTQYRVINAGHRGYSTNQELGLLLELAGRIQPDAVVLFWYWNDLEEPDIPTMFKSMSASGPISFDTEGKLDARDRARWHAKQLLRRSALVMWLHDRLAVHAMSFPGEEHISGGLRRLDGYLAQMASLAQAHRFLLLLAVVPDPNALSGTSAGERISARVQEIASGHGIPALSLLDGAREAYRRAHKLPIIQFDSHYNAQANAAMARVVIDRFDSYFRAAAVSASPELVR